MSIYQRFGQGPFPPSAKQMNLKNIDSYFAAAVTMDAEIKWVDATLNLTEKLKGTSEYSEEYLTARLAKLKTEPVAMGLVDSPVIPLKQRLNSTNAALQKQLPVVMDKVTGKDPDEHRKMSALDDERKLLEDEWIAFYRARFPLLVEVLPKIFYLILDGCDMTTVQSCFTQLKKVMAGEITSKNATSNLMNESTERYNLPAGFWEVKKE